MQYRGLYNSFKLFYLYRKGTTPAPGLYAKVNRIKNIAKTPILVDSSSIFKLNPVAISNGKQQNSEARRRKRLPLVSIKP